MEFGETLEMVVAAAVDLVALIMFVMAALWVLVRTVREVSSDLKDPYYRKVALATASVMSLVVLLLLLAIYSFGIDFLQIVQVLSQ